jgi:hypothetical protein
MVVQGQPRQKVVHTYHPRYAESVYMKITIQASLGINSEILFKNN